MEGFILVLLMLIHMCNSFNCTSEDYTCILWMKSFLGGQDACKAPKACFTADTACELLKDPCTDTAERMCNLIRNMKKSDLLCGWKDETIPTEQKNAEEKRRFEEERAREEEERRVATAKKRAEEATERRAKEEEERKEREDAKRRAAMVKKRAKDAAERRAREKEEKRRKEEESRAKEEEARREEKERREEKKRKEAERRVAEEEERREEKTLRAKEEDSASTNDTSVLMDSEGFISGFTLIEFLLVCVIMVLLSICCCCSINVFRRWCRRRMTLAGPFEGQHRTTTNCFSHCWRNAMITMQQRRLSSYLRKADALLENPAHTVYLHQYHEEVVESIYGKMGWSPVLASLGDNLSLRRGSVVRAHVHQEEATNKREEEGPVVEILAGKTGVANPHNIMDEPGVVFRQDGSKK